MLAGKKILLGVTGGIAAYKIPMLVRLLIKAGAKVRVIMSPGASQFVTAETLAVLSKNTVVSDFFNEKGDWNNHVEMGEWADLMVIAPLTANTLAKMAVGASDNVLLTTYFSMRSKTVVAPAMDLDMYKHPSVLKNLEIISSYGNLIIPAEEGELASGLHGEGRMAEPEHIFRFIEIYFGKGLPLAGKMALVTAGPTHEAIDPVRFIGNRSSGKMGIAIAEVLAELGAKVTLVLGPGTMTPVVPSLNIIHVESSDEMYNATVERFTSCHIAVCAAAVADFKPAYISTSKIKKKEQSMQLDLVQTKDILAALGAAKKNQCLVGFALETENLIENAQKKLKSKNLDMVVANAAMQEGTVFGSDKNQITIIDRHNKIAKFELKSKREAAQDIVQYIVSLISEK